MASSVFVLWHVHHVAVDVASGAVKHFRTPDDFWADEQAGDDVKLLGAYSSRERAIDRIRRSATQPGFRDEPLCFYIDEYILDRDRWTDGYLPA
jgi:hypothetical protein